MFFDLFVSLLPFLAFVAMVFVFRLSLLKSIFVALISVSVIVYFSTRFHLALDGVSRSVLIGSAVSLNVVMVVLPGLVFNNILKRQGVIDEVIRWFESWRVPVESRVLLMIVGVLPVVESLTGFGVCLLVGVPIFSSLFGAHAGSRLSMLGMNCMPWGVLALPTLVGADLCGMDASLLSSMSAVTSSLIFPYFSLVALWVCGGWSSIKRFWVLALLMSACYSMVVMLVSLYGPFELAGVLAGLCVIVVFFCLKAWGQVSANEEKTVMGAGSTQALTFLSSCRLFFPYLILLVLAVLIKVDFVSDWLSNQLVYDVHGVSLRVLGNPGLAIVASCVLVFFLKPVELPVALLLKRSLAITFVLFGFVLLSQLMSASGMMGVPVAFLIEVVGEKFWVFALLSPVLGMFSGFLAGSNLGGNALMMNVQCQIGALFESEVLFAAIQNSSAGHAVYGSLAIIVLILAIMKEVSSDRHTTFDDSAMINDLMMFGFKVAIGVYLLIVLAAWAGNDWFGSWMTGVS
ncbi:MAG: L-lactate permease [Lautropia sp.]|nr:L-lactate permease [Lautropia sp.]